MIYRLTTGLFVMVIAVSLMLCGCHSSETQENARRCDSLCDLSYKWSYKNLDSAYHYAQRAQAVSLGNSESKAQVLNHFAFIRFMQMDFVGSRSQYVSAYSFSNNILYQLVSEIGLMRICQRTSENADFYMYRNSAQRHINRIREEKEELDEREQHIFQLAVQDFHIISATYFLNLQQTRRAFAEIKTLTPDENLLKTDTAQWLALNYLKSTFKFVSGQTYMEKNLNSFDAFMYGLRISRENGYNYFTIKYLQGLAVLLNRPEVVGLIQRNRQIGLHIINEDNVSLRDLPEHLALSALAISERYGDIYLESVSWRVLAGCYFRQERYEEALSALNHALDKVNEHYQLHYKQISTPHLLEPFNPGDSISVEKRWMSNPRILTVPEWIARIREQFSLVYSALGDKMRSDYNRNIYLDILETTRQDKETEARYFELQQESRQLSLLLCIVVLSIICASFALYYISRRWRQSHQQRILKLRQTLDVCRRITSDMPENVADEDDLFHCLSDSLRRNVVNLFGDVTIDRDKNTGEIKVTARHSLSKDQKMMLNVISCFMSWAFSQGKQMVILGEKYTSIREERAVLERTIFENKKENEVRRACVSLVNNVTPLIDRMLHELSRLNTTDESKLLRAQRFEYIGELADKINDYNNLLTRWIQIRRGMFNLHIENFQLQDLFDIIAQRRCLFEREGKQLLIHSTPSTVKADRLLTLFMLNTLIENAFKYTYKGGSATVSAQEVSGYVEISIRDTGIGLTKEDCDRILNSKIYDSSSIGMADSNQRETLKKKKGFGFGLMNCKGIIEKYRKTSSLFSVCLFGIESTPGKGSRFFFRLPSGITKSMLIGFFLYCMGHVFTACNFSDQPVSQVIWKPNDILLHEASAFADSVYYNNINGHYKKALQYADSARERLNAYYLKKNPGGRDLLKSYSDNDPVELKWFRNKFNTDYHVILDIRNESAVAALALREWKIYKYNNTAYTSLFKLLGEDHRLGDYCRKMQRSSNNKIVLIVIFLLFTFAFAVAYYILYFRRRTLFLINLKQILMINRNLLNTVSEENLNLESILGRLRRDINEIAPVKELSVSVYNEEKRQLLFYCLGNSGSDKLLKHTLTEVFKSEQPLSSACDFTFPLIVEWGASHICIGSWHVSFEKDEMAGSLELLSSLMTRSLANYLFHSVVRINRKRYDVELAEDDNRRAEHEASRLYVQNQVLDNCLSTIKHETMFYPSRIRQLATSVIKPIHTEKEEQTLVAEMYELAAYYKKIYSLLTLNADRQLSQSVFKCTDVHVERLFTSISLDYRKMCKKYTCDLLLSVDIDKSLILKGDALLLYFLLRNLLKAALTHPAEGHLWLSAVREGVFVRFELRDNRLFFEHCDLNLLFSPEGCEIKSKDGVSIGTEYLICKQIVRDHAEYTANRGCRINAELLPGDGYIIWFTIPANSNNRLKYGKI